MECVRDGNEWILTWTDGAGSLAKIVVGATNVHESGKDIYCELSVGWNSRTDTFHGPTDVNLKSTISQTAIANRLGTRTKGEIDKDTWASLIEQVCYRVLTDYRRGEPFIEICDVPLVGPVRYCIEHFLPADETTSIACAGGKGKGWLAVDICLRYAMCYDFADRYGINIGNLPGVLYMDWEENATETARRFQWIGKGMGLTALPRNIIYRRMKRPLCEEANMVRAECVRRKIGLVIVDSLAPATGGEIKDEKWVTRTMEAMRDLSPATRFVIGHVTKADAKNENNRPTIIGSAFYEYLSRSYWEMQGDNYGHCATIALLHKKVNTGPLQPNIALDLKWDDENRKAAISWGDIQDTPRAVEHLELRDKMWNALERGKKTVAQLCDELDIKDNAARAVLGKMNNVVNFNAGKHGPGSEGVWGRKTHDAEQGKLGTGE